MIEQPEEGFLSGGPIRQVLYLGIITGSFQVLGLPIGSCCRGIEQCLVVTVLYHDMGRLHLGANEV